MNVLVYIIKLTLIVLNFDKFPAPTLVFSNKQLNKLLAAFEAGPGAKTLIFLMQKKYKYSIHSDYYYKPVKEHNSLNKTQKSCKKLLQSHIYIHFIN